MYFLRVFGGLQLRGPSGPIPGRLSQRRPLALLAVLAVAGDDGCTRDQLAGLLWGDTDDQHALHELSHALYVIHRELGAEAVISDATQLRLNTSVIDSGIRAFHAALGRGDGAAAAAAYGGPLLEGFHLHGSPAFEEWLSGERHRLAACYADALEGLAKKAEAASDHAAAAAWWQRLAAHDPYNSRVAVGLAFALAAVRDRANALQHLRAHIRLLHEEMGMEPDAELLAAEQALLVPRETPDSRPSARAAVGRVGTVAAAAAAPEQAEAMATPLAAPVTRGSRRRAVSLARAALVVVVVVAIAAVAVRRWWRPAASAPPHPRSAIAVLPFENLSGEGPQAYFAPGLHEAVLTQLAKVRALTLISRTSVMGYQGTTKPLRQIAAELAVGSVVEASVQVMRNRLRVNVQLIDAATDRHLWAEQYDKTLDDAFVVQSEIARAIVEAVGATLSRAEAGAIASPPTANAEAYRLYLQGRDYYLRPGYLRQNCEIAQRLFERALALDPSFALAHAALSEVHGSMYWYRYDPSPTRAVRQREEAEAALSLAPHLAEAHFAVGLAHYWGRRDYRRAMDEFRIALQGLPNDEQLWHFVGAVQRRLGNWDEAMAAFEKATRLNPRDADLLAEEGVSYEAVHRYFEAVRAYDRALGFAPDFYVGAEMKGWAYVRWHGQLDTLRAILSRMPRDANLGPHGPRVAQQLQLLLWERDADSLLQVITLTRVEVLDGYTFFVPGALYAAWAHRLRGDRPAARAAFDSARVFLDSVVRVLPDDWRVHAARGLALAGLGRRDDALREASWLRQSVVYRQDAYIGPNLAEDRAWILAQAGDADGALDEIQRLLAGPSWLSVHMLRLDPRWDPIRNDPRFKALLSKYAAR